MVYLVAPSKRIHSLLNKHQRVPDLLVMIVPVAPLCLTGSRIKQNETMKIGFFDLSAITRVFISFRVPVGKALQCTMHNAQS